MEKVYVIKNVFSDEYYKRHEKADPYMGGGIMVFWDESLIKFSSREDAEDVIKHRGLNNVIILEVYTR